MKIISTAFLVLSACWQCLATEQMPDVFIENGKAAELFTSWAYLSPLEHYFAKHNATSPFKMMHTANYRGHVGHWEVIDKKLFLKAIMVDTKEEKFAGKLKPYQLSKVFKTGLTEHGKFADWFDGSILVFLGAHKEPHPHKSIVYSIEYEESRIFFFKDGVLVARHSFKPDDYYNAVHEVHTSTNELSEVGLVVKKYFDAQKSQK